MDQIISRDLIRAKARSAYGRNVPRDGHGFNWHCKDAIRTWQAEWDWCATLAKRQAEVVTREAA